MTIRIAVIGASGFLGNHVVNALLKTDATVIATARQVARLAHLPRHVERAAVEIEAPQGVYQRLGSPDCVLHLAWDGLPDYRSSRHFDTVLPSQYRFLQQMVREGAKSIVISGTCLEYGMQSGALSEALVPAPVTPYGFAKHSLHRQLQFLAREIPFELTWGRLFYMYGEGQSKSSLYTLVHDAIARGDRAFNMSKGEQLRDFLPVETVAEMLTLMALKRSGLGIVNVCSGIPVSVRSLVEGWVRAAGAQMSLNLGFYPYPSYEPMAFWGSAEKLKSIGFA